MFSYVKNSSSNHMCGMVNFNVSTRYNFSPRKVRAESSDFDSQWKILLKEKKTLFFSLKQFCVRPIFPLALLYQVPNSVEC